MAATLVVVGRTLHARRLSGVGDVNVLTNCAPFYHGSSRTVPSHTNMLAHTSSWTTVDGGGDHGRQPFPPTKFVWTFVRFLERTLMSDEVGTIWRHCAPFHIHGLKEMVVKHGEIITDTLKV